MLLIIGFKFHGDGGSTADIKGREDIISEHLLCIRCVCILRTDDSGSRTLWKGGGGGELQEKALL